VSGPSPSTRRSIRLHLLAGAAGFAVLVFGLGVWASTTEISGAVIASGHLVTESDVKKVQHPTGGVVAQLHVRDGDRVAAGDLLARLDDTLTQANLAIVNKALDEALARQARLQAERDGDDAVAFPAELLARAQQPEVDALISGERKLFEIRRAARLGQKAQLKERIGQLQEQIQGLGEQITAKKREIALIHQELDGVRALFQRNLIPIQRVTALERDAAQLEGDKGALISSIAQVRGKITETDLQMLQIDQDLRTEVGRELGEIRGKLSELVERKVAAEDQLRRVEVRAPQNGTIHQLAVHTIGGVIAPGETVMVVVPGSDHLVVEVKVAPQDIDQLRHGQNAVLRFSAFNQRTTPELTGEISRISADLITDQRTGQSHYTVRIAIPESEPARLGDLKLTPGMPVEAFMLTQQRTVLTYFTKPLSDQIVRAFRGR
jgi:HlyD family secretion protein